MTRFAALLAAAALAFGLSGCATMIQPPPQEPALAPIPGAFQTPIVAEDGRAVGLLTLAEGPKGVLIRINLLPLIAPGWHALHFHEKAECSGAAFATAGAHVGHSDRVQHGLLNPGGPEPGDLPNILVPLGERPTIVELYAAGLTITGARGRVNLMDADGSSLMIHANPDDHMSQPIGGAGARLACASIGGPQPPPPPPAPTPAADTPVAPAKP